MAEHVTIHADLSQVEALFDEIEDDAKVAVRPTAQAAAQVIYEAVKNAVEHDSPKGHWFHGRSFRETGQKYWFDAGTLRKSIYQVYSKDNSSDLVATYHISWNHIKAPYGFMVEFGTARTHRAHPFVTKVAEDTAKIDEAADAAEKKLMTYLMAYLNGI